MVMDPWISPLNSEENKTQLQQEVPQADLDSSELQNTDTVTNQEQTTFFFEDNFQPKADLEEANKQPFSKLPDSQEYLASLEKKLSKIQKGGKKGSSASSILKSLGQTRESCMLNLLTTTLDEFGQSCSSAQEEFLAEELKVNLLLKKIAPEKQAISAEELIHLLKADQLETLLAESEEQDQEEKSTATAEEEPSTSIKENSTSPKSE